MIDGLDALADVIDRDREVLLLQWRQQIRALPSARHLDVPTLNDHVPGLLEDLVGALKSRSNETIAEAVVEGAMTREGNLVGFKPFWRERPANCQWHSPGRLP